MSTLADLTVDVAKGVAMPLVGIGTWQLSGPGARAAVGWALEAGYRHVDTATAYRNEREVGAAVRESGLPREEVFLTTKLPPDEAHQPRETLEQSLTDLGVDAVDLWLVHWPPGRQARPDVWAELLRARDDGLARSVGVSNYSLAQVDELVEATGEAPAVNQIPWSPSRYDPAEADGLRERSVALEGYSPFKGGDLSLPVVREVAERVGASPAQVIVRWHLQHGFIVIPRSSQQDRVVSNVDVLGFELSAEDMAAIDAAGSR